MKVAKYALGNCIGELSCLMGIFFFYKKIENRVSSRLLAQIRASQVFWEPIKNRASPRSALHEAVYLEALLYTNSITW